MELVAAMPAHTPLVEVGGWARQAETLGFDVMHVPETVHDAFVSSALALEHTTRLKVRTSMVVAFPRSPMVSAYAAWDLARFSAGRFQLGIASQVRGNIVGRYSVKWENPVSQLREYVESIRAIFVSFQTGTPLDYAGKHYTFNRLQPYFNPGPLDVTQPPIWMGGVNPQMVALAGELTDGLVCHPTSSHPRFLDERVIGPLNTGIERADRTDGGPSVVVNARPLTGRTEADVARERATQLEEYAFLYTTPAYRSQLEVLGLAELGEQLHAMAAVGDWSKLGEVMGPDVVGQLIPQGTYAELPLLLSNWYAGRCDGLNIKVPDDPRDFDEFGAALEQIRAISTAHPDRT